VKGTAAWEATSTWSLGYADVFVRCPRFCHWLDRRATRCASRRPANGERERYRERKRERERERKRERERARARERARERERRDRTPPKE
jgi:hypothetical protein